MEFIKEILPSDNIAPIKYSNIYKSLKLKKIVGKDCCLICTNILNGAACSNIICQKKKNSAKYFSEKNPTLYKFDFAQQMVKILEKNFLEIISYASKSLLA